MKSSLCQTQAGGVLGAIASFSSLEISHVWDVENQRIWSENFFSFFKFFFFLTFKFSFSAAFQPFSANFEASFLYREMQNLNLCELFFKVAEVVILAHSNFGKNLRGELKRVHFARPLFSNMNFPGQVHLDIRQIYPFPFPKSYLIRTCWNWKTS